MKLLLSVILLGLLVSCGNDGVGVEGLNQTAVKEILPDHGKTPMRDTDGNITVVIEIPAGTSHKYEYNYESKSYECEIRDGKPRIVKFLPYPGNYGFIPGTLMDKERGGDGDALDVLVLGESVPQGKHFAIKPIATLKLLDRGEEDHKVIAVPVDPFLNTLNVNSFDDLVNPIKTIIKTWFTSYKGPGKMEFQKWEGDSATNAEILKWEKK